MEPCGAQVKTALRKAKVRTREALDTAITDALGTVTEAEVRGWFGIAALPYTNLQTALPYQLVPFPGGRSEPL